MNMSMFMIIRKTLLTQIESDNFQLLSTLLQNIKQLILQKA